MRLRGRAEGYAVDSDPTPTNRTHPSGTVAGSTGGWTWSTGESTFAAPVYAPYRASVTQVAAHNRVTSDKMLIDQLPQS